MMTLLGILLSQIAQYFSRYPKDKFINKAITPCYRFTKNSSSALELGHQVTVSHALYYYNILRNKPLGFELDMFGSLPRLKTAIQAAQVNKLSISLDKKAHLRSRSHQDTHDLITMLNIYAIGTVYGVSLLAA
ncbi:hypothetical protein D9757_010097 [Collybiopsis confluens]|uniref:Uncharacterized protein n=1 Tax=Collybiopsis confluens TaxID=2823264 RepID=A0A8H5GMF1_9AGAR|nr:hypothetical protein D9757_010097 [Collybiopsis confluens]